jgi:hypothetical protein
VGERAEKGLRPARIGGVCGSPSRRSGNRVAYGVRSGSSPKVSLLGAVGTTLGGIFLDHLASVPEEHPSLEEIVQRGFDFGDRPDDEVLCFCRRLGNFLDIYRILCKHQPCPTGEQITAWWELLIDSNVPEANLQSLREIWRLIHKPRNDVPNIGVSPELTTVPARR